MICPKCGHENPDDAGQCLNCCYKFRFGYAYKDPQNMMFFASTGSKKNKFSRYLFVALFLLIFVLIILSSLR